jgi:glutaredoxin-like protein DUF836
VILTLLGKPDCHLCHEMHEVVAPVAAALGLDLVERDVHEDPELKRRYALAIPVLLAGDVEVVRHRTTADEVRRRLHALKPTSS